MGKRGEGYVLIQFLLGGLIVWMPNEVAFGEMWGRPLSTVAIVIGLVLIVLGVLLALIGGIHLGENLTAVPHPKEDSQLVQRGVYGVVRHPIYSGLIIGAFGWGFLHTSLLTLLLAGVLFLFFDIKARREEQWLREKFEAYGRYQKRVKKLIPYLY